MKILESIRMARRRGKERAVAMVIVMVTIVVLGAMAASLAFSMKVELTLAYNASLEPELEWVAWSGVEYARYVLALQAEVVTTSQPYDSLNQVWAGGPGSFEDSFDYDPLAEVTLKNNKIGPAEFSITIEDAERKFNINYADEFVLNQALMMMGLDVSESSVVVDSILDWIDPDTEARLSGMESEDYERLEPPYFGKDGPIDDLSELLRVNGITPELYWGPNVPAGQSMHFGDPELGYVPMHPFGFVDFFNAFSERQLNVNTVSAQVLQLLPGMDESLAYSIVDYRTGPDGIDGTEDDTPYASVAEVPVPPGVGTAISQYLNVRSATFEVTVEARLGTLTKEYVAMLKRMGPTEIVVLFMHEK